MQDSGHVVLVSEYLKNLPEGWEVQWMQESSMGYFKIAQDRIQAAQDALLQA